MTDQIEAATIRKVYWRLIPLLFVMVFINYLDRINIGFAQLDMGKQLGISDAAFGFASSIFFIGYMVLEVPSNLMLHRSLASSFRAGAAGAATIAFINTVAQFGGLVGPWSIGLIRGSTGSFALALVTIAAFLAVATIIALAMRVRAADVPSPEAAHAMQTENG